MDGLKEEWTRAPSSSGKHSPSSLRPGFTGSPARRAYDLWKTKSKAGGEALGLLGAERRRGLGRTGAA